MSQLWGGKKLTESQEDMIEVLLALLPFIMFFIFCGCI